MLILVLRDQHTLYEAQAQAVEAQAVAQGGLLARLRAIFTGWRLFNREGATDDTKQPAID